MSDLDLNKDKDYYSKEAGRLYMSVSQFKDFCQCEAQALAKLKGEWEPDKDKTALLVGNYVHSYFESEKSHQKFIDDHQEELYTKRKPIKLYKDFEVADRMIDRIKQDDFFKYLWQGEHEVPVTGELFGADWKGKIDLLNIEKGYFVDLKTTAQLDKRFWSIDSGGWVSFIEQYGYDLQIAVYEKLLEIKYGKPFTGYIYAVTKQYIPDIAAIEINQELKDYALDKASEKIERILAVKAEKEDPKMCGKCEFCRKFKRLDGFITPSDLIN